MSRNVGRGWRTAAKHELMRSMIGQEVGAACTPRLRRTRLTWLDLTAGDAAIVDFEPWHETCSPGILATHAIGAKLPVEIDLHEIQPATYDRLIENLGRFLPTLGYEKDGEGRWKHAAGVTIRTHNLSGHQASVAHISSSDAVFVLNDPNAITEWAMRDSLAQEIADRTWCFRSLSTMGCNAAGIKRLDLGERQGWFDLIDAQERSLPRYRDLLLAAIERDDAQWAYLVSTAIKWRNTTDKVVESAFRKKAGRTVTLAWNRANPARFAESKRQLFLTKKEYEADLNRPLWEQ